MAFSFLHTADIHLDSPLKSLALRNPDLAEVVANASRATFERIIDLCMTEQVQALLIAGDLYDGDQTSMKTAGFLARQLDRLHAAGIASFIIRGNHDATARITRQLQLPDSVHVFSGRASVVETDWNNHPVAVHGISFSKPHAPESLLPRFAAPRAGAFNIGMLHTSLGGSPGHDPYAPCALTDLQATGFDYWALGHIHKRTEHPGRPTVVMPGIPQGRDMGEAGRKSVTLVRVDDAGQISTSDPSLALARFDLLEVPCDGIADWPTLVQTLKQAVQNAADRETADGAQQLILRPRLTGRSPLAWRAASDLALLSEEARSAASTRDGLWIDKLVCALTGPAAPLPAGALGELTEMIANSPPGPNDPRLRAEYDRLVKHLPPALKTMFGTDPARLDAALSRALSEGAAGVLARLDPGDGADTNHDGEG